MRDVPILNPRLQVQTVGFRPWEEGWCGVLITPWFMNLVQLPGAGTDRSQLRVGASVRREFPAAALEVLVAHEAELGHYLSYSLYSPMFEFPTQDHAVATAERFLQTLFEPIPESRPNTSRTSAHRRPLSRRELFRALLPSTGERDR